MTIEDRIAELLAKAEPLRALPDDEQESMGLPGIVELINALRAEQAGQASAPVVAAVEGEDAERAPPELVKRGPGRPRKAEQ